MTKVPRKAKPAGSARSAPRHRTSVESAATDRVTYRELRNTPGRVWERLSGDRPLTLYADGQAKALLIPIPDRDAAAAQEAYVRARAPSAVMRIQEAARPGR